MHERETNVSSRVSANESLEIRIHGDASSPTLVYFPGLHGDWTLVSSFRAAAVGKVRFVELVYPRTLGWSLEDYACEIEAALVSQGITTGWLLGESFGSQIVWALVAREPSRFLAEGIILAGGFVRHPVNCGVRLARFMSTRWPRWFVRTVVLAYGKFASWRHRNAPETLACVQEFIRRRLEPRDRLAIEHRLALIAANDPAVVARKVQLPVFQLVGLIDPIVPALPVWLWLRRNCPGYRGARLIYQADHNVLGTAPAQSLGQVLGWIHSATAPSAGRKHPSPVLPE